MPASLSSDWSWLVAELDPGLVSVTTDPTDAAAGVGGQPTGAVAAVSTTPPPPPESGVQQQPAEQWCCCPGGECLCFCPLPLDLALYLQCHAIAPPAGAYCDITQATDYLCGRMGTGGRGIVPPSGSGSVVVETTPCTTGDDPFGEPLPREQFNGGTPQGAAYQLHPRAFPDSLTFKTGVPACGYYFPRWWLVCTPDGMRVKFRANFLNSLDPENFCPGQDQDDYLEWTFAPAVLRCGQGGGSQADDTQWFFLDTGLVEFTTPAGCKIRWRLSGMDTADPAWQVKTALPPPCQWFSIPDVIGITDCGGGVVEPDDCADYPNTLYMIPQYDDSSGTCPGPTNCEGGSDDGFPFPLTRQEDEGGCCVWISEDFTQSSDTWYFKLTRCPEDQCPTSPEPGRPWKIQIVLRSGNGSILNSVSCHARWNQQVCFDSATETPGILLSYTTACGTLTVTDTAPP